MRFTQEQLKYIMDYAKDKEARGLAVKHFDWNNASQDDLRYIMRYAKDKDARDLSVKHFDWKNASQNNLKDIMRYAKDKETQKLAIKLLPKEFNPKKITKQDFEEVI